MNVTIKCLHFRNLKKNVLSKSTLKSINSFQGQANIKITKKHMKELREALPRKERECDFNNK